MGARDEVEKSLDVTRDPQTLGMAFEAIRLLAGGVALIYLGYLAYNTTQWRARGVLGIMGLDSVAALIAGLIFWLVHTRRVKTTRVQLLSAILAFTVALNVAISVPLLRNSGDLQFMMVVAMGGAMTVISVRWLTVVIAGPMALGLCAAFIACSYRDIMYFAASQTGASAVAVVIYLGRIRGQRRLLQFRIRDAHTNEQLTQALDRAEREFSEHQVAERHRLELLDQLRQAQKLEALGTLAGGIAHDINNVIGAITAIASATINEMPSGAQGRKELKHILVAAKRSTALTRNLVRFARQDQPHSAPFGLDEDVVLEIESLLRRTLPKHIQLEITCACPGWVVMGDSGQVGHALLNLCLNSAEAITNHGLITVRTGAIQLDTREAQQLGVKAGSYVELVVCDNGSGMSPEVLERAFEPFFSTKDGQRRSGLGLPMVYGTIQQHEGGLRIESAPAKGTQFRIVLPAHPRTQRSVEVPAPRRVSVNSHRPIALFVDDEPLLRKAGKRMLVSLGYEVLLASNGQEALVQFAEHSHRIGVVVLDVAMPIMGGAECCRELKRLDRDAPVILTSGFPKGADIQSLLALPNVRYLRKPYELDELVDDLAQLGSSYRNSVRIACQVNMVPLSKPPPG